MKKASTSTNFPKIHIIDWNLVDEVDPKALRITQDRSQMKALIKNFLNANAMFADPSFCPPDLVFKYFQLLQISVKTIVDENTQLRKVVQRQKIQTLKAEAKWQKTIELEHEKTKSALPQVIFQCPFCPKAFYSTEFVHKHINREHQQEIDKITKAAPKQKMHKAKTLQPSKKNDVDLDTIRDEIKAMFDHFDTTIKLEQEQKQTEMQKKIRELERKVRENEYDAIDEAKTIKRKLTDTSSLATYSGHQNTSLSLIGDIDNPEPPKDSFLIHSEEEEEETSVEEEEEEKDDD